MIKQTKPLFTVIRAECTLTSSIKISGLGNQPSSAGNASFRIVSQLEKIKIQVTIPKLVLAVLNHSLKLFKDALQTELTGQHNRRREG